MSQIRILNFDSLDSVYSSMDEISAEFISSGVLAIRGLSLDNDEYESIFPDNSNKHQDIVPSAIDQTNLAKHLGDRLGWFPNSSVDSWSRKFVENHSRLDLSLSSPDQPIIDWHLEHVDYDSYIYLVASVWNMWHFDSIPGTGNTWFVDSLKLYDSLNKADRDFLSACILQWYDSDGSGPHQAPAVAKHWLRLGDQVRMEITTGVRLSISSYHGSPPTEEQQAEFRQIKIRIMKLIYAMGEEKSYHSWKKGDVVIVDLFRMIHTVGGGFDHKDRIFTNIFAYSKNPEILSEEEKPIIWRNQ